MASWTELVNLFEKGGLVMPLLLAGSILSVAVAVERLRIFARATARSAIFREQLVPLLAEGDLPAALALARQYQNLPAVVAEAGLCRLEQGNRAMELAMEDMANRGAARLRQRLDLLSLMVTMAPLLGLLGTVVGMIRAFNVLNVSSGQPFAIVRAIPTAALNRSRYMLLVFSDRRSPEQRATDAAIAQEEADRKGAAPAGQPAATRDQVAPAAGTPAASVTPAAPATPVAQPAAPSAAPATPAAPAQPRRQ